MTTERSAWLAEHPTVTPTVCHCGQDLDLCAGAHCPRCGVALVGRAA